MAKLYKKYQHLEKNKKQKIRKKKANTKKKTKKTYILLWLGYYETRKKFNHIKVKQYNKSNGLKY